MSQLCINFTPFEQNTSLNDEFQAANRYHSSQMLIDCEIGRRAIEEPKSLTELTLLRDKKLIMMESEMKQTREKIDRTVKHMADLTENLDNIPDGQADKIVFQQELEKQDLVMGGLLTEFQRVDNILSYTEFHPSELTRFQQMFVSSAQLVECTLYQQALCQQEQSSFVNHKKEAYDLFYMKKVYTYQGKRYYDDTVVRVRQNSVAYDEESQEQLDTMSLVLDIKHYQNINCAKLAFLRNSQHLAQRHKTQHDIAQAPEPKHTISDVVTYAQFLCSRDSFHSVRPGSCFMEEEFSKLVTIDDITYIISENVWLIKNYSDADFELTKEHFLKSGLSLFAKYVLMSSNYIQFDFMEEFMRVAEQCVYAIIA